MECATPEKTQDCATTTSPPKLFVVWIDTNCGYDLPDWEMNSCPKTMDLAEQEASECLVHGFLSLVLPDGQTPRADGLFSNPATDPID